MYNYLDLGVRRSILQDMDSEENTRRKKESLMKYEIYKSRQAPFVYEKIKREMGTEAAKSRTITSINLTKKIINEQSKIYLREPEREYTDLNEAQQEHVEELYEQSYANIKLKKLNRIYKLNEQAALQIIPKDGKLEFRPLYPHQYDVVPKLEDPEKADAYIISSFNKSLLFSDLSNGGGNSLLSQDYYADNVNQKIGDPDDYSGNQLFYWWTDKYNFITNKVGEFVDKSGNVIANISEAEILNPIQQLPFVDVALDKDFEFFVRAGSTVTDFSLDLATLLSDTAEISRLQGFAFGVMASVEEPKDLKVGPRNYLWLKLDPNASGESSKPSFNFTSPNPDLGSSLQLISNYLSMYLSSIGQSSSIVATGDTQKFTSGVDRFLFNLDKFEQSQDDVDLFKAVEKQAYQLVKAWNNVYYNSTTNGFIPELSGIQLPEDSYLEIKYNGPEMILGEVEKLDVISKKKELGLISRVEAVMEDRSVDKNTALEIIQEIDKEDLGQMNDKPILNAVDMPKDSMPIDDEVDLDAEA